tara:strand:+ start:269 stop:454 length:186 start_codon:yes stop_codon:yes gene_type:complete
MIWAGMGKWLMTRWRHWSNWRLGMMMMMMIEGADRLCVCLESLGQIEREKGMDDMENEATN